MMEALARNYNNRNANAKLFELAKEFIPGKSIDELPEERQVIAMGMYGKDVDYFCLKGSVEMLMKAFGITDFDVTPISADPTFHPGRCAHISKNSRHIAALAKYIPLCAPHMIWMHVRCWPESM